MECPKCKTKPIDFEWMDFEEEHFIENGEEFIYQGGYCQCDDKGWIVTYKLIPVKMEKRK